jgi:hypothetical protein
MSEFSSSNQLSSSKYFSPSVLLIPDNKYIPTEYTEMWNSLSVTTKLIIIAILLVIIF